MSSNETLPASALRLALAPAIRWTWLLVVLAVCVAACTSNGESVADSPTSQPAASSVEALAADDQSEQESPASASAALTDADQSGFKVPLGADHSGVEVATMALLLQYCKSGQFLRDLTSSLEARDSVLVPVSSSPVSISATVYAREKMPELGCGQWFRNGDGPNANSRFGVRVAGTEGFVRSFSAAEWEARTGSGASAVDNSDGSFQGHYLAVNWNISRTYHLESGLTVSYGFSDLPENANLATYYAILDSMIDQMPGPWFREPSGWPCQVDKAYMECE